MSAETNFHPFQASEESEFRCRCGSGWAARIHRGDMSAPRAVKVQAIVDLDHLVLGQRLLIDGERYEVAEVMA